VNDANIYAFLAARRKFIAGLLAIAGILAAGQLVPHQAAIAIQAIIGFLGVYGIHEVANDQPDTGQHAA
jgi:hypothetical protein